MNEHIGHLKAAQTAAREARRSIIKRTIGYIGAGLGLVAGLAWNEAIKGLIDYLIPSTGSGLIAKIVYAVIVTIFVGVVLFYLERSLEEDPKK